MVLQNLSAPNCAAKVAMAIVIVVAETLIARSGVYFVEEGWFRQRLVRHFQGCNRPSTSSL